MAIVYLHQIIHTKVFPPKTFSLISAGVTQVTPVVFILLF